MTLLALASSLVLAGGLWLIISSLWPPRASLAAALEHLHTPASPKALLIPTTASDSGVVRAGRWVLRRFRSGLVADDGTIADLEVVRRPLEVYAGICLIAAAVGAAAGPAGWLAAAAAGTTLPVLVPVWLAVFGAVCGFVGPRLWLRAEAVKARRDFRHALSAYLDVLVLLLAAGEGPEGAMVTAARAGNGEAFMAMRQATVAARLSGEPVWDSLDELGRRLDIVELREIAAAGTLAGERGASVRKTLMTKARSLRTTSLTADEATARRRSETMFAPIVVMGVGFALFLIYPLVSNIQLG
jgi:tight adherence protein C